MHTTQTASTPAGMILMPIPDMFAVRQAACAAESRTCTRSSPHLAQREGRWGVVWGARVPSPRDVPRSSAILCLLHHFVRLSGRVLRSAAVLLEALTEGSHLTWCAQFRLPCRSPYVSV
eukprot:2730491-Prymnesium_polylepis.1